MKKIFKQIVQAKIKAWMAETFPKFELTSRDTAAYMDYVWPIREDLFFYVEIRLMDDDSVDSLVGYSTKKLKKSKAILLQDTGEGKSDMPAFLLRKRGAAFYSFFKPTEEAASNHKIFADEWCAFEFKNYTEEEAIEVVTGPLNLLFNDLKDGGIPYFHKLMEELNVYG